MSDLARERCAPLERCCHVDDMDERGALALSRLLTRDWFVNLFLGVGQVGVGQWPMSLP
jgi:hypothetical protein